MQIKTEFQEFLATHRWAVLTHLRASGGPVSSVIAYAQDADDFIVSTPGTTFRARSIARDSRVNLCVISNSEPFNFVALEGNARVETDNLEALTQKVFAAIADTAYQPPADMPAWLEQQQRVILRITPQRVHGVIR